MTFLMKKVNKKNYTVLSTNVAWKLLTLHFPSLTSAALNYIHEDPACWGWHLCVSESLWRWERKPGKKVATQQEEEALAHLSYCSQAKDVAGAR